MRPGLRVLAAFALALVAAVALGEAGLPAVFDDAGRRLLGIVLAALLAAPWGSGRPQRLASAAAAATTCAILVRAPLPFVGLGAVDLGYGRVGEHAALVLPFAVTLAVALFGDRRPHSRTTTAPGSYTARPAATPRHTTTMFILRATPANPHPPMDALKKRVRSICPEPIGIEESLQVEDEEFVDMMREQLAEAWEDETIREAFGRVHEGDPDTAPDEMVASFGLAQWGRDWVYVLYTAEDVGGEGALGDGEWIDALLALAAEEKLRVFDELVGEERELPA